MKNKPTEIKNRIDAFIYEGTLYYQVTYKIELGENDKVIKFCIKYLDSELNGLTDDNLIEELEDYYNETPSKIKKSQSYLKVNQIKYKL